MINIEEFNVNPDFRWTKFPLEKNNLSILIVYNEKTISQLQKLVNKLLLLFPNNCYYNNDVMKWINLPKDMNGYKLEYLDKIFSLQDKTNNTLIIDIDNLQIHDENDKNYPLIDDNNNKETNRFFENLSPIKTDSLTRDVK